jgi:N-acetylglutamate synthase-like GNAT family acetyltransferase
MPSNADSVAPRGFLIRLAADGDLPAIRAVLRAVREEYGVAPPHAAVDDDLLDMRASYFDRGGLFEVIEDAAGRIVGCVGMYPLDERRVELRKMYILRCARGCGLGKRLLDDVLAAARVAAFAEVWLETHSTLKEAIALYERNGFRPVDAGHLGPRCDQAYALRLS